MFDGLTQLMSTLLIHNVRYLRQINANGIQRLINNVFSLQQNLITSTIVDNHDLDRCRKYYELFKLEETDLLLFIRGAEGAFSFEEYEAIVKVKFNGKEQKAVLKKISDYFVGHRK